MTDPFEEGDKHKGGVSTQKDHTIQLSKHGNKITKATGKVVWGLGSDGPRNESSLEENSWTLILSVLSGDCLQGAPHEKQRGGHPDLMEIIQICSLSRKVDSADL